ncbi:Ig-like domain-containing protein, partial [Arthrobacter sp. ES1]
NTATANGNFTIKRTSNGAAFTATVSYSSLTRVATLNPTGTLLANTQYTVTLSSGIKDTAGNLLTPVTWNFTTGN